VSELRLAILVIHVLAACLWVGGLLVLALVVMPAARRLPEEQRNAFTLIAARRFAFVGWGSLGVLVLTGIGNVLTRGYDFAALSGSLWTTQWGSLLAFKLFLVSLMGVMAWWHERYFGPRAIEAGLQIPPRKKRLMIWAARATVMIAVVVVALGILLSRT